MSTLEQLLSKTSQRRRLAERTDYIHKGFKTIYALRAAWTMMAMNAVKQVEPDFEGAHMPKSRVYLAVGVSRCLSHPNSLRIGLN